MVKVRSVAPAGTSIVKLSSSAAAPDKLVLATPLSKMLLPPVGGVVVVPQLAANASEADFA